MTENYKTKLRVMQYSYSNYRKEWEDTHDDRRVFCNVYDMLMEALEVMKGIDNNLIWVGFNMKWDEDRKLMDEIIAEFN